MYLLRTLGVSLIKRETRLSAGILLMVHMQIKFGIDVLFLRIPMCPVQQIREFIDLIGSLLSASSGNHSENRSTQISGLTIEMIRSMREVGVVSALTNALKLFGMGCPDAPKAINAIIKPLEVLTRTIPAPNKRSTSTAHQGGQVRPTWCSISTQAAGVPDCWSIHMLNVRNCTCSPRQARHFLALLCVLLIRVK